MAYVIAELGSNPAAHGWNLEWYVRAARACNADAVKIQVFRAGHFPEAEQSAKRRVEFPRDRLREFARLAHGYGLDAGASVFDAAAAQRVAAECDFLKLAGREYTNQALVRAVHQARLDFGKPVYRSMPERACGQGWYTWYMPLGVVMDYPTRLVKAFWTVIQYARYFNENVKTWGWSSHTASVWDCLLAVRLGASIIEKHFAVTEQDPERGHSLMPKDFMRLVYICKGDK